MQDIVLSIWLGSFEFSMQLALDIEGLRGLEVKVDEVRLRQIALNLGR